MSSNETAILKQFQEFLVTRNLRMTKERESLVREILRTPRHFEAEQLILRLRRSRRRVSRATVYRTLMLLEKCGILRKSTFGHDRSYYETVLNQDHHDHLICLGCGSIEEFHSPRIESDQKMICLEKGFELIDHIHEMYGLCPKCSAKSESPANT